MFASKPPHLPYTSDQPMQIGLFTIFWYYSKISNNDIQKDVNYQLKTKREDGITPSVSSISDKPVSVIKKTSFTLFC